MKKLHIWTNKIRRSLAFPFPVTTIGCIPDGISRTPPMTHQSVNFCFRISGAPGEVESICDNVRFIKRFPSLIIHHPGKVYVDCAECVCNELYISYNPALLPGLRRALPGMEIPYREIVITSAFSELIKNIQILASNCHDIGAVDRLDISCFHLIAEALLTPLSEIPPDSSDTIIRRIASHLEINFAEPILWDVLLKSHGISARSFTRHWRKAYHITPTRFINNLKIREAHRLLGTTTASIKAIAQEVGIEDVYYFSRLFKKITGNSPVAFRHLDKRLDA